jgi:hypothetical protein
MLEPEPRARTRDPNRAADGLNRHISPAAGGPAFCLSSRFKIGFLACNVKNLRWNPGAPA